MLGLCCLLARVIMKLSKSHFARDLLKIAVNALQEVLLKDGSSSVNILEELPKKMPLGTAYSVHNSHHQLVTMTRL